MSLPFFVLRKNDLFIFDALCLPAGKQALYVIISLA